MYLFLVPAATQGAETETPHRLRVCSKKKAQHLASLALSVKSHQGSAFPLGTTQTYFLRISEGVRIWRSLWPDSGDSLVPRGPDLEADRVLF